MGESYSTLFKIFVLHDPTPIYSLYGLYGYKIFWSFFFIILFVFFVQFILINVFIALLFEETRIIAIYGKSLQSNYTLLLPKNGVKAYICGLFACCQYCKEQRNRKRKSKYVDKDEEKEEIAN